MIIPDIRPIESTFNVTTSLIDFDGRKNNFVRNKDPRLLLLMITRLNPVNLSEHILSEDQTKLLRKGPSFCPAPRDINWQEVHDDLEAFEARLRTAAFFMEKNPEVLASNEQSQNHLPIPGKKGWKPISKFPELELFYLKLGKTFLILETLETCKIIYLKGSAPCSGD